MVQTTSHIFSGKVDIESNLLVGSSHLFVDTINNRVGVTTADPDASLHVNGNAYVESNVGVGSNIFLDGDTGIITATEFRGDGSNLVGVLTSLQNATEQGSESNVTIELTNDETSLIASGNVTVAGNVTASTFVGDGSQLTGIATNLQAITDNGNVTSNTVQFTNTGTSLTASGTIEAAAVQVNGLDVALDQDMASNAARIGVLETDLTSNAARVTDLEAANVVQESLINNLRTDLDSNAVRVSSLETDRTSNTIRISILESANIIQESLINNLRTDLTSNTARIVELEAANTVQETLINDLRTDVTSNTGRIAVLETDLTDNASRITVLEAANTVQETLINNLRTDVTSNTGRIAVLETDLTDNVSRIETLEVANTIQASLISTLESANTIQAGLITNLTTDLSSNAGRITDLETANGVQATLITNLTTDLSSNHSRITALESSTGGGTLTLQGITDLGNTTTNVVRFTNATTGLVTTANVEVGGDVKISGLTANKIPVVGANKFLEDSLIGRSNGKIVISSDLEVSGNIVVDGNSYIIESNSLVINDRILGISNNNTSHELDVGIIMGHPGKNVALIHHGESQGDQDPHDHTFTIGYTQNNVIDNHIFDDSNIITVEILGNLITQNNLTVGSGGSYYGDGTTLTGVALQTDMASNSYRIGTIETELAYPTFSTLTLDGIANRGNTTSNVLKLTNATTGLVADGNVHALKFIGDGSELTGIAATLQEVSDNGNVTSNTIQFTNATTGFVTTSNIEVGGAANTGPLTVSNTFSLSNVATIGTTKTFTVTVAPTTTSGTVANYPTVAMTGPTTSGYTATGSYNASQWLPFNAFNDILGNEGWHGPQSYDSNNDYAYSGSNSLGGVTGEWIKLQLPDPIKLSYMKIAPRENSSDPTIIGQAPEDLTILGSNDDTNWTVITSVTGLTPVIGQYDQITAVANTSYTYYAVVVTRTVGPGGWLTIGEIEFWGELAGDYKYFIDGVQQDTLELHENQTYVFDLSSTTLSSHPFVFQQTNTNDGTTNGTNYETGITNIGTYASDQKRTFIVPPGAPTTLYYYCTAHSGMGSTISISPTAELVVSGRIVASGNVEASKFIGDGSQLTGINPGLQEITDNGNVTTSNIEVGGTVTTGPLTVSNTFSLSNVATMGTTKTFVVTVSNATGANKYYIDDELQPTIELHEHQTYIFDLSSGTLSGHPFVFQTTNTNDGTTNGTDYETGITSTGTYASDEQRTFVVPAGAPTTLYYYCTAHSGMGGTISISPTAELVVSGRVVASGNVEANTFIGDGSQLTGISGATTSDLQVVTTNGATSTQSIQLTNTGTSLAASGAVTAASVSATGGMTAAYFTGDGSNVNIGEMTAETVPYVDANKQLRDSHITRTADTTVITSNLQVDGNLFVNGTRYFVNSEETVINDRIIGLANNNTSTTLDIGLMLQYPQKNVAMIHHGTTSGSPHNGQLTLGYTQSGFDVDNITKDPSNNLTLNVWGHVVTQNNITVGSQGSYYGDGTTLTGVALSADLTNNVTRIEDLETATIISNSSTITTGFTKGDIIYASADNVLNKLAIGTTDGYVLKVTSAANKTLGWAAESGGGGSGSTVWQQNGSDIYYSSGDVGINTSTPAFDLDVHGTANVGALTATSLSVGGQTLALASDLSSNASRLDAIYNGSIGDIIYVDAANSLAKLGIGSSGQVLKVSAGGVPEWANESGGGGGSGTSSQWTTVNTNEIYYDGNVGIANTDPGHDLSVGSNLYVDDDGSNVLVVTGNTAMSTLTLGEVSIVASYSLDQVVNTGNVTSNTVQFSNAITSLTAASNVVVTGNVTAEYFVGDGSNLTGISSTLQAITDSGNVTSNTIQFSNAITGLVTTANVEVGGELTVSGNVEVGTANLFVDTVNSRVGIGMASPLSRLHVGDGSNPPADTVDADASLTLDGAGRKKVEQSKPGIYHRENVGLGLHSDYKMSFEVGGSSTLVEAMRINNDGDLGIATTTPRTTLHVTNQANSTGTGDAYLSGVPSVVSKPTECLRLQGKYHDRGSGALVRFTNQHNSGTFPNTGEYNLAGIAGYDHDNSWGGGLAFYTSPGTGSGGDDLTLRISIDSLGHIKYHQQPRFCAYSYSGNGTYSGFASPVALDRTYYNVGSHYNTSSGAFTAPVSGHYRFTIVLWNNTSSGVQGSLWYRTSSSGTWDDVAPYKLLGASAAGDEAVMTLPGGGSTHTFEVYVPSGYQIGFGGRGAQSLTVYRAHSYFSGELISVA